MTYICVGKLTIIGSDNGLAPGRHQAIIWTNAGILLIEPLGANFSEILIGIQIFSFKKMRLKMSSAKWLPFCLGLNVLSASFDEYSLSHILFPYFVTVWCPYVLFRCNSMEVIGYMTIVMMNQTCGNLPLRLIRLINMPSLEFRMHIVE